jgi:diguanylate cyclase (GGDEF)-like protein/PAS domain S-box-containing protein
MSVQIECQSTEVTSRPSAPAIALDRLLRSDAGTLVAAFGNEGAFVPMPATVPLHGRPIFEGSSGLDLVDPRDHPHVIAAWDRAKDEPIVSVGVHLVADPDHTSTLHVFDLRSEHGVRVLVLEARDTELVVRSFAELAAARRGVARVKRDGVGVFLEVDDALTALLGWQGADLIGRRTTEIVHPDDVERAVEAWMAMRAGSGDGRAQIRVRHAQGHYVWIEATHDNRLEDPDVGAVLSKLVDISDEMAHLEALHDRERSLALLAESLPIGICQVRPDREVVYSNEPFRALLGAADSAAALVGRVDAADRGLVEAALLGALRGRPADLEVGVADDATERRCELTFRAIRGDDGTIDGVIVCAADVTERSRLRAELEHRATHDALSGCLNRAAAVAALERALLAGQRVAVAFVDLDHFKGVNDELGHAAGDELLRVAADRMRAVTRRGDQIGRMGGDEFVVIAPHSHGQVDAQALADRLTEAIGGEVRFGMQRVRLHASVGVAISLDGELDAEGLLIRADAAMYSVKRDAHGRDRRDRRAPEAADG